MYIGARALQHYIYIRPLRYPVFYNFSFELRTHFLHTNGCTSPLRTRTTD